VALGGIGIPGDADRQALAGVQADEDEVGAVLRHALDGLHRGDGVAGIFLGGAVGAVRLEHAGQREAVLVVAAQDEGPLVAEIVVGIVGAQFRQDDLIDVAGREHVVVEPALVEPRDARPVLHRRAAAIPQVLIAVGLAQRLQSLVPPWNFRPDSTIWPS
jgi:hypothetical protein